MMRTSLMFFFNFSDDLEQISFLTIEQLLHKNQRTIVKSCYQNNKKTFLVCYQLWKKFGHEFFYLEEHIIKYSVYFEMNKVNSLLDTIEIFLSLETKLTVLTKSFF